MRMTAIMLALATAMVLAISTTQGLAAGTGEQWRFKWHEGRWWYWMPDNHWMYWDDDHWNEPTRPVSTFAGQPASQAVASNSSAPCPQQYTSFYTPSDSAMPAYGGYSYGSGYGGYYGGYSGGGGSWASSAVGAWGGNYFGQPSR